MCGSGTLFVWCLRQITNQIQRRDLLLPALADLVVLNNLDLFESFFILGSASFGGFGAKPTGTDSKSTGGFSKSRISIISFYVLLFNSW
jgi:hypothetical protein